MATTFAAYHAEATSNINAITGAVTSLTNGMAGGFLQTAGAARLQKIVQAKDNMIDGDRQDILAFLSGSTEYVPSSGQITGLLKELGDEMSRDLADTTATEEGAIKTY